MSESDNSFDSNAKEILNGKFDIIGFDSQLLIFKTINFCWDIWNLDLKLDFMVFQYFTKRLNYKKLQAVFDV